MSEAEDGSDRTDGDGSADEQAESKPATARAESADLAPTDGSGGAEELAAAGETMASGLSGALDEDAPLQQRKEGVKQLGSLVSGVLNGVMDYQERKQNRKEKRAQEANLEETTDKPTCECGLTFTEIPLNADRIACPECGKEYSVE